MRSVCWALSAAEMLVITDKYGDDRRSKIGFDEFDISMEDMIPEREYDHRHDEPWLYQANDRR